MGPAAAQSEQSEQSERTAPAAADPARPAAAQAAPPTVQLYGRSNSFQGMPANLPSGQNVATNAVPGWGFPAGRLPSYTARAADGTILMSGWDHNFSQIWHTGDDSVIGTFNPAANSYANVRLSTSCNTVTAPTCTRKTEARRPVGDPAGAGHPAGVEISDLQAIDGSNAIAFSSWPAGGQDINTDGVWPAFGILTNGPNGWRVAEGPAGPDGKPTWMNQWTGAELSRSNGSSDVDEQVCQRGDAFNPPEQSDCYNLNEMSLLPRSNDLVIAQYAGAEEDRTAVAILDVTADSAGRYTTVVKATLRLPSIPNLATPDPNDFLDLAPIATETDPSSVAGDERFLVTFDIYQNRNLDADPDPEVHRQPGVIIEYSYNATTGAVTPVSAPIIPPDGLLPNGEFAGFVRAVYDHNGTLWVGRDTICTIWCQGGRMAVFPKVDGQRRIQSSSACRYNGGSLASYTTTLDGKTVWGEQCRPNYDIVQPKAFLATWLVEDPPNGIVATNVDGHFFAVRSSGSGTSMRFQVANPLDAATDLLPGAHGFRQPALGAIDPQHRLWAPLAQNTDRTATGGDCWLVPDPDNPGGPRVPLCLKAPRQVVDQWLYSIDLDDLYDAPPVTLTTLGAIQAEQAQTTTTHERRPGTVADVEVDSDAYYEVCAAPCETDGFAGEGFMLMDDTGYGHLSGTVDYEVTVPTAGNYTIFYRAGTHATTPNATIRAWVGSATVDTNVAAPDGGWTDRQSAPVFFPAGTYNIRLSVPEGGGGWYLSWLILVRA